MCTLLYIKNVVQYDSESGIHLYTEQFSLDFGLGDPVDIPPLLVALVVGRILAPAGVYPF